MHSNPRYVKVLTKLEACLPSLFSLGVQESKEINSSECEVNCCNWLYINIQKRQVKIIPKLGIVWLKKSFYNTTDTISLGFSFKIISHYIKWHVWGNLCLTIMRMFYDFKTCKTKKPVTHYLCSGHLGTAILAELHSCQVI